MCSISKKRTTEFTVTWCAHKELTGSLYSFDGEKAENDWGMAPSWLPKALRDINRAMPPVSCREVAEVISPETGERFATVAAERYIDVCLGDIVELNAGILPDKEAFVDAASDRRVTYKQLRDSGNHLARVLIDLNVAAGDHIAAVMPNSIELAVANLAIAKSGAVVTTISPYEKEKGLESLLRQTDAKALFIKSGVKGNETIEALYSICPELKTTASGRLRSKALPMLEFVILAGEEKSYPGMLRFEDLLLAQPKCTDAGLEKRRWSFSRDNVAAIIHTSGSTSTPKSVMLTHAAIVENAVSHMEVLQITAADRIFAPVPIFHSMGLIGACITAQIAGATAVFMVRPKPDAALGVLERERCTAMFAVPSYCISLVEEAEKSGFDTSALSLRLCAVAGAGCPPAAVDEIRKALRVDDVIIMYGMTEASPGITSTRIDDSPYVKANTVGRPWPGVKVRLDRSFMSDDGAVCGEVLVSGYNIMRGYYKDPEASAQAVDAEGWLHTGDIGYFRDDGNLVIRGRSKDIITRNGLNISPREIENCLESHQAVAKAYVVAAQDYKCGEVICAFVALKKGAEANDSELIDFCRGKISTIKIPSYVSIVEDFPKSSTGKVLRRSLREMAQVIHNQKQGVQQ